jgi:hypothetical protein
MEQQNGGEISDNDRFHVVLGEHMVRGQFLEGHILLRDCYDWVEMKG